MDFRKTGTFHNEYSQVTEAQMNHIVAQRDHLIQILIQKDIALEQILSKANNGQIHQNSDARSISHNKMFDRAIAPVTDEFAQSVDSIKKLSLANIKCECSLLKGLNKSLENEVESLKTVNKILQNNFDILNGRLERVQSDHQLRLKQLYAANRLLEKSVKVESTKKRARSSASLSSLSSLESTLEKSVKVESTKKRARSSASMSSLSSLESTNKNKRRCFEDIEEKSSSVNDSDCDVNDESDHVEDSDDSAEDDVVFVETTEKPAKNDITIDVSDTDNEPDDNVHDDAVPIDDMQQQPNLQKTTLKDNVNKQSSILDVPQVS